MAIPAPDREGFTTATPHPLYWRSDGSGPEKVLVLHGGPGAHHDYLLPQMLRLASPARELLFYDQRGGGRSRTDDPTPITWQTHASDLARVVDEFHLKSYTVVGYSWGALLALLYSLEAAGGKGVAPRRLVLIDPAPLARRWRDAFEQEFARRQRDQRILDLRSELAASGLRESDPEAFRQRQFELGVAGYFADPTNARDLTPFRVTGRVQQSVWESLGNYDLIPRLATLKLPALVLHGRQDPIPLESSESGARAMGARCVVLEASGHVPYVEQPNALFAAIEQFLEETANDSR